MNQKQELEGKFKFLTRWIFEGIIVNLKSKKDVWLSYNLTDFKINDWNFEINESNIGALQLICSAIETYGRILLGCGYNSGFSEKSFVSFISKFFLTKYKTKANEIYSHYRCSLLHSHILGYNSNEGFFPTRGNDRQCWDKHLKYTNSNASSFSNKKDSLHQRLIINIDDFYKDLKKAVEKYIRTTLKNKKISKFYIKIKNKKKLINILSITKNARDSLKDVPLES